MIDYDSELRAHNVRLRAAAGIVPGEQVLDIGCGAGQTTRDAARAAAPGHVLGVDISAPMLEQARELTDAEQLENVAYELGDAQVHPFAAGRYDVAISRFGSMFFSDPAAALGNIARALRPGGRLVLLVWQSRQSNQWAMDIDAALSDPARPPEPVMPDSPFSLSDPAAAERLLERAGFRDVGFDDVREPVVYGRDVAAAMEFVGAFQCTSDALARLAPADAAGTLQRLRDLMEANQRGDDGVVFDSRAWMITAQRG